MSYRLIIAGCASLAACASAAPPLDQLVGFSNPQACEPNEAFASLLSSLVSLDRAGESYIPVLRTPATPAAFKARAGTPHLEFDGHEYRATLPLTGDWQGLPLRSVAVIGWIESEQGFAMSFDATPQQVLAAANRAGMEIPSSGSKYQEAEVLGLNIGVGEHEGGAALFCIPG